MWKVSEGEATELVELPVATIKTVVDCFLSSGYPSRHNHASNL